MTGCGNAWDTVAPGCELQGRALPAALGRRSIAAVMTGHTPDLPQFVRITIVAYPDDVG